MVGRERVSSESRRVGGRVLDQVSGLRGSDASDGYGIRIAELSRVDPNITIL